MNGWGWSPRRRETGRVGSVWARAFAIVVPFVTVGVLLLLFYVVSGTMTTSRGILFDLPDAAVGDEAVSESVILLVPVRHETLVFFDDARYVFGSAASMRTLEERLSERFSRSRDKTLLVLADRRISCGDLMAFAAKARQSGVEKVLFAERSQKEAAE